MRIAGALIAEVLAALEADPDLRDRARRVLGLAAERDGWLPVVRAVKEYGLPVSTVRRAIDAGELAAKRVGRADYVQRSELDRWLATQTRSPKARTASKNRSAQDPERPIDVEIDQVLARGRLRPIPGGRRR